MVSSPEARSPETSVAAFAQPAAVAEPEQQTDADCDHAGEIVIPEKELSLLRTLRNQAVLAIKQSS